MNVDQRCAFRMVYFIECSLCIRLESDLNDSTSDYVSQLIFVSHDALCLMEYLHYLHKDVVKQHYLVAIALDYYLQNYHWIICSGLWCFITKRKRFYSMLLSPLDSVQRYVQSSNILSSTFMLHLPFKTTQPCFFAKTFGMFSTNTFLMYLH